MLRTISNNYALKRRLLISCVLLLLIASTARGQTTVFTYQGRLSDGGAPANGAYDLQFKLFDTASTGAGTQIGSTITNSALTVTGGVFTTQLDFGASAFPGADRFLEISVRLAGSGSFTVLSPRQPVTATPYSIRSASAAVADTASTATNATQLGGVAAGQYVLTSDSRLSDPRPPTAGSSNYIQNTTSQQGSSNFNISGNGTAKGTLSANILNADTQYNMAGNRVLISVPALGNLFLGDSTGIANTTGGGNSFFGNAAGKSNSTGSTNSFFGAGAGSRNTTGNSNAFFGFDAGNLNTADGNSFFGRAAGEHNTAGGGNSFFGFLAGQANTTGLENSFVGAVAGFSNTTGSSNSFYGVQAGVQNTSGSGNSFFGDVAGVDNTTGQRNTSMGFAAGDQNTTGSDNSFFGDNAGESNTAEDGNTFIGAGSDGAPGITNATAIGSNAQVTKSNSLVLGSISVVRSFPAVNVGIGTTAPNAKLQITSGDVYVQTQGKGIILRATDGPNCYRVTVNNTGVLATTLVTCP